MTQGKEITDQGAIAIVLQTLRRLKQQKEQIGIDFYQLINEKQIELTENPTKREL